MGNPKYKYVGGVWWGRRCYEKKCLGGTSGSQTERPLEEGMIANNTNNVAHFVHSL